VVNMSDMAEGQSKFVLREVVADNQTDKTERQTNTNYRVCLT